MAGNDSPDQDMERLLRRHFTEETPDLQAPTDTWTQLESRLDEQRPKPGWFAAFRNILSPASGSDWRLRTAGAALALVVLLAGAAVLITVMPKTTTGLEASAPSLASAGIESAPPAAPVPTDESPASQTEVQTGPPTETEPSVTATVQRDSGAVEKEAAIAGTAEKNGRPANLPTPSSKAKEELVHEATPPVAATPEGKADIRETAVEKEVAQTPAATATPEPTVAPTSQPTPALAELNAPEDAIVKTVEENRESEGQGSATTEPAPQSSAATPYPQETPAEPARRRRGGSAGGSGGGGGYAPLVATATPSPQETPDEERPRRRRRGVSVGGSGSYATPSGTAFEDYQRSRFAVASEDNVSTFSLDTDRTSYQLALNWARSGHAVNPDSVRAEEWINAFDYQYSPPSKDDSFSIKTGIIRHPLDSGKHLARVAFQAPEVRNDAPLNVTLVLDSSGSMQEGNRVAIARAAAESIRRSLRPQDSIAVVQFSGDVVREATVGHSHPESDSIYRSIKDLRPRGSTNVQAGIDLGVEMADHARRQRPEAHNYIVLMSDGVANVDATNPFVILKSAYDRNSRNPLRIITIGVGIQNYNDHLLEQLAQHGNGWYRYLNDVDAARRTFSRENWLAISTPFADQTRAQVTWDPEVVNSWRIIGYENRVTPDKTFTQDRKEFAEIPSGAATTVFYELELNEGAIWQGRDAKNLELGKVQLRWVKPGTGVRHAQHTQISGDPRMAFNTSSDYFLRLGAIAALASDRFSALSSPQDGLARGIHAELSTLQDWLQLLKGPLGRLKAYGDLAFLLDHMADRAAELAPIEPQSGYSR